MLATYSVRVILGIAVGPSVERPAGTGGTGVVLEVVGTVPGEAPVPVPGPPRPALPPVLPGVPGGVGVEEAAGLPPALRPASPAQAQTAKIAQMGAERAERTVLSKPFIGTAVQRSKLTYDPFRV